MSGRDGWVSGAAPEARASSSESSQSSSPGPEPAGCVGPGYIAGMQAREQTMSTYLGAGVAIPHGTYDDLSLVHRTGISVLQVPGGVEWEPGEIAYLVVGIAARGDDHIDVLSRLGELIEDEAMTRRLVEAVDAATIVECLRSTGGSEAT